MAALAHSASKAGLPEPLKDHLAAVASRAREFAAVFGAGTEAEVAGLFHDLGKYGDLFQGRLAGREQGIDHWSPGAWACLLHYKNEGIGAALAIQGHHIGLQIAEGDSLRALEPRSPELLTHQGMVMQRFRLHGAWSRALRHGTTA